MLIEFLKSALFGIVEGITEWLPISSTGHMILLEELVHMNVSEAFWEMFLVVIQLGAIMAVVVLYFDRLNPFSKKKSADEKKSTWQLWIKMIIGIIPAAVVGLLFDDWFDEHFYNFTTVAITLILYGIAFIVVEYFNQKRTFKVERLEDLSYVQALIIGLFMVLSIVPGTSRSGATILGASLIGISRAAAAEFSFFLAIPTMAGASLLKLVKYFLETGFGFSVLEIGVLLVGMIVAFAVSMIVIKFLMSYIRKHDFTAFGYYRIILGIIVLVYAALK